MDSFPPIVYPFTLMFLGFALTALAFAVNVRVARRYKRTAVRWLESQGHRVAKAEYVYYPVLTTWRPYIAFEIRSTDASGLRYHAIVAVPRRGVPWILDDKISSK